jgi:hypothetical protein
MYQQPIEVRSSMYLEVLLWDAEREEGCWGRGKG